MRRSTMARGVLGALCSAALGLTGVGMATPASAAVPHQVPAAAGSVAYGYTLYTDDSTGAARVMVATPDGFRFSVGPGYFVAVSPDLSEVLAVDRSTMVFTLRNPQTGAAVTMGKGSDATLVKDGVALLRPDHRVEIRAVTGALLRVLPAVWGETDGELQASRDGLYLYQYVRTTVPQAVVRPMTTGAVWRRYDMPWEQGDDGCDLDPAGRTRPLDLALTCYSHQELRETIYFRVNRDASTGPDGKPVYRTLPDGGYVVQPTTPAATQHTYDNTSSNVSHRITVGGATIDQAAITGGWDSTLYYFTRTALVRRDLGTGTSTEVMPFSGTNRFEWVGGQPDVRTIDGGW
ncbi:hypothetical protein [Luteipulveratus flavus]|uniref:Uncharacterized protein n=1 Tax=Luteipulveratus flavus TaxID=3031728 RepID=A0ABT6C8L3_9MICO|nr:hypothetical protein [Luteipulveratus sp. YIM 133296]MDF8265208.1 hypothetical protein [Luteipulveratus sp. YIM 133296]